MSIKNCSKQKIAIFYDWLNQWGGAERVLLDILKIYPHADLFTLVHEPSRSSWLPKNIKITTSFINKLPFSQNNPIFYTPLYDIALEQFDFSSYDIVISTTSVIGHCLLTPPKTLFITYFHNVNRHLYRYPFFSFYQKIDQLYGQRPDAIICNSQTVKDRIQNIYHRTPTVINPGIDTDFFHPAKYPQNNYFLVVGRQVAHKRTDLVIDTFKSLPHQLIIVGSGRQHKHLVRMAEKSKNIKMIGQVNESELLTIYQNCKALICPQLEDFGLTALEAQACSKPVIAFNKGGNTETVIAQKTGVMFSSQTATSLKEAIANFHNLEFSPTSIRQHAMNFSHQNFMLNFKQSVDHLWQQHLTTMS